MSSSGIVPINGGSVIFRTYLDTYNENTYLLGQYDYPLLPNNILVTSTNGLLISTTTVNVSSVGVSSIFANTVSTNQLFICTIYYSTLTSTQLNFPSTIANQTNVPIITFSSMTGGTLSFQQVTTSSLYAGNGTFSTLSGTSLTTSTAIIDTLSTINETFSTMTGSAMFLTSLSAPIVDVSTLSTGCLSMNVISSVTLQASNVVVGTEFFSSITGGTLTTSTLITSSLVATNGYFSTLTLSTLSTSLFTVSSLYHLTGTFSTLTGSTISVSSLTLSSMFGGNETVSSAMGSSIVVSLLTVSSLTGGNQFFSTLSGSQINASSIVGPYITSNTIQFSTMNGSTATIPLIFVSTLNLDSFTGSTLTASTLIAVNTYASSIITSSISVNTYYLNQAVYGQTIKKDSIDVFTNVTLQASDIVGFVDNPPSTLQVYTIGSTIQNLWIAGTSPGYATSSDGETWTSRTLSYFAQTNGIVWTGNLWVAVGSSGAQDSIATSTDGINWIGRGNTLLAQGSSPTATIVYANSVTLAPPYLFITGGFGLGVIGYSGDNGTTWFNISNSSVLTTAYQIAWNGIRTVVVGTGTSNTISWSDHFLVSWNTVTNSNVFFQSVTAIIWTGHQWVAGGLGANRIMYSLDAVTWISSPTGNAVFNSGVSPFLPYVSGFGWNGSMMIAVGYDITNTLAYSMDGGVTWTGLGKTIFTDRAYSVTWNGQMWVATGNGTNSTAYSYNGIHWYGGGITILPNGGFCTAFNYRRPYTLTIPNTQTSTIIGTVPNASLPIVVPANSQLDIVSDSYYNSGYTNFSIALQTHAS